MIGNLDCKLEQKENIDIQTKKKAQPKKITGFQVNLSASLIWLSHRRFMGKFNRVTYLTILIILQYNPSNPSELLIASADSRIRLFDGSDITHKFRGTFKHLLTYWRILQFVYHQN